MLSAIANFFSGDKTGPEEEEKQLDFFTQEADDPDWLLVDILGDEKTLRSPDDRDKENEDPDEDDVLSSVPHLLPLEPPMDGSIEQPLKVMYSQDNFLLTPSTCTVSELTEERADRVLPTERFVGKPLLNRAYHYDALSSLFGSFVNVEIKIPDILIRNIRLERKACPFTTKIHRRKSTQASSCKTKAEKTDTSQSHPAELTAVFVNPQSTHALTSKAEYMQQVKELQLTQHAKEQAIKKHHKRNQLSRQNKVYLYESSNKNQHRKDLWWRHSGANNNRKCC